MTRWCGLRIMANNIRFSMCHNLKLPSRESIEAGVVKALLEQVPRVPCLHFLLDKTHNYVIVGSFDASSYAHVQEVKDRRAMGSERLRQCPRRAKKPPYQEEPAHGAHRTIRLCLTDCLSWKEKNKKRLSRQ